MQDVQMHTNTAPLAYTINDFAEASGVGRTSIFAALRAGEINTISPVINGKVIKRRLITPEEGKRWLSTFPATEVA
jgi:hypothetical protein